MIFGIGTDIVDTDRILQLKSLKKFAKKILSPDELDNFDKLNSQLASAYIAKQFAAKEAFSKALGNGISGNVKFSDIEIMRDLKGKPYINLQNKLKKIVTNLGITKSHVSLADEKKYAIAFVILEK